MGFPTHDRPGYLGSASIRIVAPAPSGFTALQERPVADRPAGARTGGPVS